MILDRIRSVAYGRCWLRSSGRSARSRWSSRELGMFLERLAMYIEAGLQLNTACAAAAKGLRADRGATAERITAYVESGMSLSASLAHTLRMRHSVLTVIAQGEHTGTLAQALRAIREHMDREGEVRRACASAMAYPVVIGIVALLITIGLVRGIIPQIAPMLTGMNASLPLLTRAVMWVSDMLASYGAHIVVGAACSIIGASYAYSRSSWIRRIAHELIARLPIIGTLVATYHIAAFARSLGLLVMHGVPAHRAYADMVAAATFIPVKQYFELWVRRIEQGAALAEAFSVGSMPVHMAPFVMAGEAAGTLGESLIRAASIAEGDIETALKRMASLLEPALMVGMGGVVGAISLSIMIPIYDISRILQQTQ